MIRRFYFGDNVFDELFEKMGFVIPELVSSSKRLSFYDPEQYDLVPKQKYIEERAKKLQEEIDRLAKERENLLALKEKT